MVQTIIDCFPDFANEYGVLGCLWFSAACVSVAGLVVSLWRYARESV